MTKAKAGTAKKKAKSEQKGGKRRWMSLLVCLAVITSLCTIAFAVKLIRHQWDLAAFQKEMAALPALPDTPEVVWYSMEQYVEKMQGINPDYVASIQIGNAGTNYPVVRGEDNVKYLNTTFDGSENQFGALFMDYRCEGENLPHLIIYGHHAADMEGNRYLFGLLDGFLDEENRTENGVITLFENGRRSEFEIFSARVTDVDDPAYQLDFSEPGSYEDFLARNGAPPGAAQILTLSTCAGSGENDMRIIVQGVLREVREIDQKQVMVMTYE